MIRSAISSLLSLSIVSLVAFYSVAARAQEVAPVTAPVTHSEFRQAIDELKQEIQSLKTVAPSPPVATSPSNVAPPAGSSDLDLAARIAALEKQVADLRQLNKELSDGSKELNEIARNHTKMLTDIAADRTSPDGAKYFVPSVRAIRDDQDSRRQLVDTVAQGMTRSTGELKIRNNMGVDQTLIVNGVLTVRVPANAVQTVNVPSGTATTELAGEGVKSWAVAAPNYSQDIVIAPARNAPAVSWQYDPLTGAWHTVP